MNVPYRWLQSYVPTTTPPVELGERFRMTSSECEGVSTGFTFDPLVVSGHVTELVQHPNADRLRVATVNTGEKKPRTIVCGAKNIQQGQYVIVAKPGATLHPLGEAPFTIAEATLRGVLSQGMICAADELGLNAQSVGIIVLDHEVKPGTAATVALGLNDAVIDLEITPNRPDLLSFTGLAREVATFEKIRLSEPPIASIGEGGSAPLKLDARIEDSKLCLRYSAVALDVDGSIESPWWLQARLILAGIKPNSAVVDVTNYVMLELGQPLHAFDMSKLASVKRRGAAHIIVRSARSGETIELLDGSTRTLEVGDTVIADADDGAIALGGVMGGLSSMITATTTRVLLESATFAGGSVRRTSRRLGLRSEASSRFEKGIDPELTITALKRATYLLQEIAGAKIVSGIEDVYKRSQTERPRIHLSFARIQQVLGVHINAAECKTILLKLGFQLPSFTKAGFEAVPPSWRADVKMAEDVIEEIVRIWGFERLPMSLPGGQVIAPQPNDRFNAKSALRSSLAAAGAYETVSLPFVSAKRLERALIPTELALPLDNPLSKEGEFLAPSHILAFLENISGVNREIVPLSLFEIGAVFGVPRTEKEMLSLIVRGHEAHEALVRQAKGMLEAACSTLDYEPATDAPAYFDASACLSVSVNGKVIGHLGFIAQSVLDAHKIRRGKALLFAELSLEALLSKPTLFYVPEDRFPGTQRDMTLVLASDLSFSRIAELLEKDRSPLLKHWSLTGLFTGKPLAEGTKSVTIRFEYNAGDRTLTDDEVRADQERLSSVFISILHASIS
jgi:phenylalanyl-tRNA synthetase beta chain